MKLEIYGSSSATPAPRRAALKIGFVLLDKFTLTAFSTFIDAIRLAADLGGRSRQIYCSWSIMGSGAVRSSCGLQVTPDEALLHPERFDYIAVCGGNGYEDRNLARDYASFLNEAERCGVHLIGVCTGSFALAEAGLLDGHRACVHWNVLDAFQRAYPSVQASSDQLFIESGPRITCAGSLGGADLALFLIARHCSPEKAQQAARHMLFQGARPADYPQPHFFAKLEGIDDPVVRRVMLLMEQSMNEFRPISWFAQKTGVSIRQIERRFRRTLGFAPAAIFRRLRLDYAAFLLNQTDKSIMEIAIDCGFVDSAHMARDFRSCFDATPTSYRFRARADDAGIRKSSSHEGVQ
jgi:transcriptional regulator GlxA family with amidase domain